MIYDFGLVSPRTADSLFKYLKLLVAVLLI
jgi:hypothetical protein